MNPPRDCQVIACATVIEEMMPLMPETFAHEVFDLGLHLNPDNLRQALQEAIDRAGRDHSTIILGYGLCSMALVGLQARDCTLVAPKVDDCIAIFLGSGQAYHHQSKKEPGTYYLTKGWIEVSDTLVEERKRLVERYGQERADFVMGEMLRHYKRLLYIDTGAENQEQYRQYAQQAADQFSLRYEETKGSRALVIKMLYGPWDDEILVAPPGHTITYQDFRPAQDLSC